MNDLRYDRIVNRLLNWRDFSLDFGTRTYIMGILNLTPDSFSDGGDFTMLDSALKHAALMESEGADIIDVGGESTRPGSKPVLEEEEIKRVVPFITSYKKHGRVPISLDTSKASVGRAGLEAGADMINDVWGFQRDPELAKAVYEHNVPAVLMHNQYGSEYEGDIIEALKYFFDTSITIALNAGIKDEMIILDPGIGFGKTQEHNREVLARMGELHALGFPLLLGTSRKSIVGSILNLPPKDRVEGTLATSTMGILAGADILRVHDVLANKRVALVTDKIIRR